MVCSSFEPAAVAHTVGYYTPLLFLYIDDLSVRTRNVRRVYAGLAIIVSIKDVR